MTIDIVRDGGRAAIRLTGRLDTVTAPELDALVRGGLDGIDELTLDCAGLEYISSAGLRVLLSAEKLMQRRGGMRVKNVNETVREVFELTGFSEILTIE